MREKILEFVKHNIFPILIVLVAIFLFWVNFTPGTWLIGWDTLHPEFDFLLNFKRLIFGVWREEQGLGAVAGHSHMADLPRVFLLFLFSFILPLNFLRFSYFALSLIIGPLGVYYFLERLVFRDKPDFSKKIASFLGGLFYLLNLGTLQQFFEPFEMFAAQYAFLPWLFLFATKFFLEGQKKYLVWFTITTILAAPMAYAATLWYVYFTSLLIYSITLAWNYREKLSRLFTIILLTLLLNAYWLLPNLYFLKTSSAGVSQAKINQLFSEKAFAHDIKYATLDNAALLRGFLFDWQEYHKGEFTPVLNKWTNHLQNPLILGIGWVLFGVIILGIFSSIRKKEKLGLVFLPLFLFTLTSLVYATPPLNYLFEFLREHLNLFKEGLRFPWTKFSLVVIFCYSIFFAWGVLHIAGWMKRKGGQITLAAIFTALLILWMLPAFSGDLIDPLRRINIPTDYFKTFNWFKDKPASERIALLPTPTLWGWEYYDWGFEGAGFLWFGLKQPILVRDFDRWNPNNENFYWEFSYAAYSKNLPLLEKVLEKYQVNWLLVDESMLNPAWPKALYTNELEEILSESQNIKLVQTFGKIKIYQVELNTSVKNSTFLAQNLPSVGPEYKWNNYDQAYLENGIYLSNQQSAISNQQIYYPFRSLFTGRQQDELEFSVEDKGETFLFTKPLPESTVGYVLEIPEFNKEELTWVNPNELSNVKYFKPEAIIENGILKVWVPKVGGYSSTKIDPTNDTLVQEAKNCNQLNQAGKVENEIIDGDGQSFLRLTAQEATNCSAAFWLPNLPHSLSYLITVESHNVFGKSLLFWLENLNIRKADIETYLPSNTQQVTSNTKFTTSYFVQPPMESDGLGYTLHFDNISIGNEKVVNDLGEVMVNPIPYRFLTQLKLVKPGFEKSEVTYVAPGKVEHPNPSLYIIQNLEFRIQNEPVVLVLSQAFDPGWLGYEFQNSESRIQNFLKTYFPFVGGKKIENHVLVNNWENGWVIESQSANLKAQNDNLNLKADKIVIVFWPQYLEYLGFTLLIIPLLLLLKNKK